MYMREPEASPRQLSAQFTRARRGGLAAFAGPSTTCLSTPHHRVERDSGWNQGYLDYWSIEPNPYFLALKPTSSRGEGRAGVTEKCAPLKLRMRSNWRLFIRLNAEQKQESSSQTLSGKNPQKTKYLGVFI